MSKWDERPQDLNGAQLIAWALTTVADAIDDFNPGDFSVERGLDGVAGSISAHSDAMHRIADWMERHTEAVCDVSSGISAVAAKIDRIANELELT